MLDELIKAVEIGNASSREAAIRTLIDINDEQSRRILTRIANDENEFSYIRSIATSAIGARPIIKHKIAPLNYNVIATPEQKKASILDNLKKDPDADFLLYYLKVVYNNRAFYKIGVTTSTVENRYREDMAKVHKVLFEDRVVGALKAEKQILSEFKQHLFPLAVFKNGNGHTEFFDKDVLELDR